MLPTLLSDKKPALTTSVLNALIVFTITITFATLELWFSAITGMLTSLIWTALAIQTWRARQADQLIRKRK
jgi:hypothetical protein